MFTVKKLVKSDTPRLPLKTIANAVLGRRYTTSVVISGERLSQKLNRTYRKENKGTNVLSFPLGENEGEIFLNWPRIRKEARERNITSRAHFAHLFIHALLHLKGYAHSSKMDSEEQKVL